MPRRLPPKIIGEWVECEFLARAAQHGLVVSKPYGDSAPFDFVVGGRQPLHRVQVRATSVFGNRAFRCSIGRLWPRTRFNPRNYDFLAVYVIPYQAWYLIPTRSIRGARWAITLFPHVRNSKGKYEQFRDAWRLLGPTRNTFLRHLSFIARSEKVRARER